MNSALKPVLPQPGVSQGGQASPAKANVASVNNSVGHPQGAQNSHHGTNNLVGQNLSQHLANAVPPPLHAVPSMAPVSANMAQMAQNMSHHGNLSHTVQNSVAPTSTAASPTKTPTTSAPLSLVATEKAGPPVPLALTRTPEKKEPDSTVQSNGTAESPKSASSAHVPLKPQNPEGNKEKQDIAKTSPSTPKPPEKPANSANTPQKAEASNAVGQADSPVQPKVTTAHEPPQKSPSKPAEPIQAPTADVAPTQSDSKPVPESAKDSLLQEKVSTPQKLEPQPAESAKVEASSTKPEEKKLEVKPVENPTAGKPEEVKPENVAQVETPVVPIVEEQVAPQVAPKPEEKEKEKKVELKTPTKAELKPIAKVEVKPTPPPKSTLKLATVTPPIRKRRHSPNKLETPKKSNAETEATSTPDSRMKRNRTQVQLYQSPTPDIAMATKLSASTGRSTPTKQNEDKLIVFYKNEYLAVRNAEGGFYVCQAVQNVYRTTRKIKIRWLSQDKSDPSGESYKPDFYDVTDMECVLTTLSLSRSSSGALVLKAAEAARAKSILTRALAAGSGEDIELTPEHPDGLDLSLYTDESQLEKKSRKRSAARAKQNADNDDDMSTPAKKARPTPKRSKSARKSKSTPKPQIPQEKITNNKRKSPGSTPIVASTSKTATAVTEKSKVKTPAKRTPVKPKVETPVMVETPGRSGRRAAKEIKASPAPTPSTSTGKATRPRKPPSHK